jgi:hypothetical protein
MTKNTIKKIKIGQATKQRSYAQSGLVPSREMIRSNANQ